MTRAARTAGRRLLFGLAFVCAARVPAARAYDPSTTHAGLTERAVLASGLHRVLAHRLARPLGLFEPVALRASDLPPDEARSLTGRLWSLDSATGCRPGPNGVASALAWVVAGSVIAETPPERVQNLFYDPRTGAGLSQAGGVAQIGYKLRMLFDAGGGLRALATGTMFDLTGRPSTLWLVDPDNDVGLPAFYASLEGAVTGADAGARSTSLARALLALGGTLAVLEDAGEPALVRNDFRDAFLATAGSSPFDRSSAFERYVADAYGRIGVPPAALPTSRPTVMAYITAADGEGLADRTQRRFFSDGTLPDDGVVDHDTTPAEILRDARESLAYPLPRLPHIDLRPLGETRYAYAPADTSAIGTGGKPGAKPAPRRLLAYQRVPGRVRFFLDAAVYGDTARALLPEIGSYAAGLIDHLFRVEIQLTVAGGNVTAAVAGARGAVRSGDVRLYAEDAAGGRRAIATLPAGPTPATIALPPGTRRVAAVLRGSDDAGELVAVAEQAVR